MSCSVVLLVLTLVGMPLLGNAKRIRVRVNKEKENWKVPAPMRSYSGEGVDQAAFSAIRNEAADLFNQVLNMNRSVEVTGHIWMFPHQAMFYQQVIAKQKPGSLICEVGFGSGLSSLGYLRSHPDIRLLTFDLWEDTMGRFGFDPVMSPRKELAYRFLKKRFGSRWHIVKGDSYKTIPQYFQDHPDVACDVIHIDGNHTKGGTLSDIVFFQTRAKKDHVVLMDDLQFFDVQGALQEAWQAVASAQCFRTDHRDLNFVGRRTSRRALKQWCLYSFKTEWVPGDAFKKRFIELTGLPIPETLSHGNKVYDVPRLQVGMVPIGSEGDVSVPFKPFPEKRSGDKGTAEYDIVILIAGLATALGSFCVWRFFGWLRLDTIYLTVERQVSRQPSSGRMAGL